MRAALRNKRAPMVQTSVVRSYPAPVSGWNARDALASMQPTDAIMLKNWFPRASYVEFRGGHASHATAMTGIGKTLMVHNKLTGSNQMFCFTASGTYNVSSAGAVGTSVIARTNGKHQTTMFSDGTNNWSIAVNGVDKPAYYDGTTWTAVDNATTPALTGVTTTTIVGVNVYKNRLFFIVNNSLDVWYLPSGSIGGALTKFPLGTEAKKGGYLVAMVTWTRDAGDGSDDVAVFLTSEGEAIVYQGDNPSSASFWQKIGTYKIGKPLGYRCASQYAGEAVIITENGVFPMSALLQTGEAERAKFAMSYKIQNAFTNAARSYRGVFGWKTTVFPAFDAMLVNVPLVEDGEHEQYVMNTITKSWCKFTEWDAEDFAVFNYELYFVKGLIVYKAWTGVSDLGANISFYAKQAFQNFGDENPKQCKMFMPILTVNGPVNYGVDVDVDFADDEITGSASYAVTAGGIWNTSEWNEAYWSSGTVVARQWTSPAEWMGRWLSGKIKIDSLSLTCQWMASSMIYEQAPSL